MASAELFDLLPEEERERDLPRGEGRTAPWASPASRCPRSTAGFAPTAGRAATLHPFRKDHFLGSGPGEKVLEEAGLDGESQYRAIKAYLE